MRARLILLAVVAVAILGARAEAMEPAAVGIARGWPAGPGQVPFTLQALTLDTYSATEGQAFTATVSGDSAGSTLALTNSVGGKYSLAGNTLSGSGLVQGTDLPSITETNAGARNSPRLTVFSITVAAPSTDDGGPILLLLLS